MKLYSSAEKPLEEEDLNEKPAPYNWLAILAIFIAYIIFALVV